MTALDVLQLAANHCRWPVGDPRTAAFYFCGHDKVPGLPYCSRHARSAFLPPPSLRPNIDVAHVATVKKTVCNPIDWGLLAEEMRLEFVSFLQRTKQAKIEITSGGQSIEDFIHDIVGDLMHASQTAHDMPTEHDHMRLLAFGRLAALRKARVKRDKRRILIVERSILNFDFDLPSQLLQHLHAKQVLELLLNALESKPEARRLLILLMSPQEFGVDPKDNITLAAVLCATPPRVAKLKQYIQSQAQALIYAIENKKDLGK
jgi:GcrA cell cycle regulator